MKTKGSYGESCINSDKNSKKPPGKSLFFLDHNGIRLNFRVLFSEGKNAESKIL